MGIPFFIVFVLSIVFLSLAIIGGGEVISIKWPKQAPSDINSDTIAFTPYLKFQPHNYRAIGRCVLGFLLFLVSLYFMGFFLYLEERESGRIMKNVKSFAKLRRFLERYQKRDV